MSRLASDKDDLDASGKYELQSENNDSDNALQDLMNTGWILNSITRIPNEKIGCFQIQVTKG